MRIYFPDRWRFGAAIFPSTPGCPGFLAVSIGPMEVRIGRGFSRYSSFIYIDRH